MKKGQGISMNVIIIAALALLVLVVLAVIFINRAAIFDLNTRPQKFCEDNLQGECRTPTAENACPSDVPMKVGTCGEDSNGNEQFCCKP